MPRQVVFPCSSCGASLSVDEGASSAQCQFCGSTVAVPATLRGAGPQSNPPYSAGAPAGSLPSGAYGFDPAQVQAIGNAVRAGNKVEAARLYQAMFGGGQAEAQQAVDTLAAGGSVTVGRTATGVPQYLQVDPLAPATPYVVPVMSPMMNSPVIMSPIMGDPNRVWRGIFGLNLAITALVGLFTVCITGVVALPFVLLMVPGLWSGLAHWIGQLTSR